MLVLARQLDESIMIGDDVMLTIVDIRGDMVRVGIAAPSTVAVHRQEVYEMFQRETLEAANAEQAAAPGVSPPERVKPVRLPSRSKRE